MQEAADDKNDNEDHAVSAKDYLMGIESDFEMVDDIFGSPMTAQERQMPLAKSAEEEEEEEKNSQEEEKSPMAHDQIEDPQTGLDIPSLAQMQADLEEYDDFKKEIFCFTKRLTSNQSEYYNPGLVKQIKHLSSAEQQTECDWIAMTTDLYGFTKDQSIGCSRRLQQLAIIGKAQFNDLQERIPQNQANRDKRNNGKKKAAQMELKESKKENVPPQSFQMQSKMCINQKDQAKGAQKTSMFQPLTQVIENFQYHYEEDSEMSNDYI